jgi:hypothetical protein
MKKIIFFLIIFTISFGAFADEIYKPYILGAKSSLTMLEVIENLKTNLKNNELEVVGEYTPANDNNRYVLVISSEELKSIVMDLGGLSGFLSALRIGINANNGAFEISYVNPAYLAMAYLRSDYDQKKSQIESLEQKLQNCMQEFETVEMQPFGSEKGLTEKKLKKYKYMMAMPKFDNVVELAEFESYEKALETIQANLELSQSSLKIYQIDFPEQKLTLFGVALSGENGEEKFLPIIDISEPKHTAFLPYEMLVLDNKVVMLHGRYRIALSFPDLTMVTFMKIMSTPGEIEDAMKALTK